jgi:hypothetical protein
MEFFKKIKSLAAAGIAAVARATAFIIAVAADSQVDKFVHVFSPPRCIFLHLKNPSSTTSNSLLALGGWVQLLFSRGFCVLWLGSGARSGRSGGG